MKNTILKIVTLLLLVSGIALSVLYRDQLNIEQLDHWVDDAGLAGPLLFMLIYAAGTVLFFPGSVLTLAGGALFGPLMGTFFNLTAATAGALVSFVIARYLAYDKVESWAQKKEGGLLRRMKQGVDQEGWKFVAFVRLVPLFPFNLLNYVLGLTRISALNYTVTSFITMLPGAIAYTYIGYAGHAALSGDEAVIRKILIAIMLLAIVGFLPGMMSRLRNVNMVDLDELRHRQDAGGHFLLLDVRSKQEFEGELGHIAGALLVPLPELKNNLESLEGYRDTPVYLICRTDVRSAKAARLLGMKGFSDVRVVCGGMQAWNQSGLPVE